MRPIDADALLEYFADAPDMSFENFHTPISTLRQLIADMPTIDAVPVVRCKDCKNWIDGICKNIFGLAFNGEDDFCSYGERKDDGLCKED